MYSVLLRRLMLVFAVLLAGTAASELQPAPLLRVRQNDQWGFIDRTGKVVVKPSYYQARAFCENRALVQLDMSYGYIGPKGTVLVKPKLTFSESEADSRDWLDFSEGLAPYYVPEEIHGQRVFATGGRDPWPGKWGYIDTLGKTVIQPQYYRARPFQAGLAAACDYASGKWGFINRTGAFVVVPQFDDVGEFSEGLASVEIGEQWGFVDTEGKVVVMPRYDQVEQFSGGLVRVRTSGSTHGCLNRTGTLLVDKLSSDIGALAEGLIPLRLDTCWGYIDTLGNTVILPRYTLAKPFSEGLGRVNVGGGWDMYRRYRGGEWGFVRRDGSLAVGLAYDDAEDFSEGLAAVKVQDKWGYIDAQGHMVVQPQFEVARKFVNGRATVQLAGKQGCINRSGEVILRPEFDFVDYPQEGIILLNIGGKRGLLGSQFEGGGRWGYADTLGSIIVMPQYAEATRFHGGIAKVVLSDEGIGGKSFGYVDATGKYIWSPSK